MRQQIDVIVRLTYDAPASITKADVTNRIHDDISRLFDSDSTTRVELCQFDILKVKEEHEIYSSDG